MDIKKQIGLANFNGSKVKDNDWPKELTRNQKYTLRIVKFDYVLGKVVFSGVLVGYPDIWITAPEDAIINIIITDSIGWTLREIVAEIRQAFWPVFLYIEKNHP